MTDKYETKLHELNGKVVLGTKCRGPDNWLGWKTYETHLISRYTADGETSLSEASKQLVQDEFLATAFPISINGTECGDGAWNNFFGDGPDPQLFVNLFAFAFKGPALDPAFSPPGTYDSARFEELVRLGQDDALKLLQNMQIGQEHASAGGKIETALTLCMQQSNGERINCLKRRQGWFSHLAKSFSRANDQALLLGR